MTKSKSSWRDVLPTHPAADLFPLMSEPERRELAADIRTHGLRAPAVLQRNQDGVPVLLDGRNRLDALDLLGEEITLDNSIIFNWVPDDIDPYALVVSANIHRRHLSAHQKRQLIAKLVTASPEKSDRQIADEAKSNRTTVGKIRKKLEMSGDVSIVNTRTDRKGRKQAAHKPKPTVPTMQKDDPRASGGIKRPRQNEPTLEFAGVAAADRTTNAPAKEPDIDAAFVERCTDFVMMIEEQAGRLFGDRRMQFLTVMRDAIARLLLSERDAASTMPDIPDFLRRTAS
jgi:ParB-like chromosome segregation protein Spo0J